MTSIVRVMRHTSSNQVNIQIKLCVHPDIISKGTKARIKRSFKVVTWLGSKRMDICGKIEFKRPSIREHSFYLHSKDKFTWIPLILHKPLMFKHDIPWSWQLILFLDFSFFFFFFFSFDHVHISFLFLFLLCLHNNVVLIKNKNTSIHLTINSHLPFSPQLESKHNPILNVPLFYGKGQ